MRVPRGPVEWVSVELAFLHELYAEVARLRREDADLRGELAELRGRVDELSRRNAALLLELDRQRR